jgi:hypothetical protein
MFTRDEMDELDVLEDYFAQVDKEEAFLRAEAKEIARGKASGSPWFKDPKILSPEAELRKEFPGIDDNMIRNILTDKNPQRIAEVKQTMREALTMGEKGMSPEGIIKTLKDTSRKKQASGGRISNQSGGPLNQEALIQMYLEEGLSYDEAVAAAQATSGLDMDISKDEKAKGGRAGYIFGGSAGLRALLKRLKGSRKRIFPYSI